MNSATFELDIGKVNQEITMSDIENDNTKYIVKISSRRFRNDDIIHKDENGNYVGNIYNKIADINSELDSRFMCIDIKYESYTYPRCYKAPKAYFKTLKPMTIKEIMLAAVEAGIITNDDELYRIVYVYEKYKDNE